MASQDPRGESPDHTKERFLLAALPHVPFTGWSHTTLAAAVRELGMEPGSEMLVFPDGPRDLVAYFSAYTDEKMAAVLAEETRELARLQDRIAAAVRVRLDLLARHREAVRRALAFLALPANVPLGLTCLGRTVDAMWHAVGDESTDFAYYTKRMSLAGIYSATLLYWLDDQSEGFQDTFAFLDRRLADMGEIGKARARVEKALENVPNPLRFFGDLRGRKRGPTQPTPPVPPQS